MTTLSLLGKALYEETQKRIIKDSKKWAKYSNLSECVIVTNDEGEDPVIRITHDVGLLFGQYYRKLVFDENPKEDDIKNKYDQNISDVYACLQDYVADLDDSKLQVFIKIFCNKIKLIVTVTSSEEKAFQLFEILNNRGRSLEPLDLIKNVFLQKITGQMPQTTVETFIENWKESMNALVISSNKVLSSSTFMKYFILYKYNENITAESSYTFLKDKDLSAQDIIDFSREMKVMATLYAKIESGQYGYFSSDRNMSILFDLLGIRQYHALFMLLINESDDNKKRLLDVLVRHAATFVFSDQRTNNIEAILPTTIRNYKVTKQRDSNAAFNDLLTEIENDITNKSDILSGVVEKKSYTNANGKTTRKAMQLLKFIELFICNNPIVMSPPNNKKLTVEHIQSQRIDMSGIDLNDLGYENEEERLAFLNRIGNLTLLFNLENTSLGEKQYKEKIDTYKTSDFIITKSIVSSNQTTVASGIQREFIDMLNRNFNQYTSEKGQWTKQLIVERSKHIGELLYKCVNKVL